MSRGKFPRDTRNPCSFCAVAIFVNLGTDLHDLFQIWPIVQCLDKKIDSFADISLVDVCSCVTHESLQARRYSLQAVPGSLQANRANLYVD